MSEARNAAYGSEEKGMVWCYTDKLSYAPGETAAFHVSCKTQTYSIEIARIGAKREVVWSNERLTAAWHPIPERANEVGCGWPVSLTLDITSGWRSGYYQVLVSADGETGRRAQSEHFFVVRSANPGKDSKILYVLSTNTYHAYNSWGGANLYSSKSVMKGKPSFHSSILRPFEPNLLTKYPNSQREVFPMEYWEEEQLNFFTLSTGFGGQWEGFFAEWLEKNDYAVDYAIQYDIDVQPELLDNYSVYLSVGHDEYWSWKERDVVEAWVDKGGKLAMFSGNSVFWQIRFEDNGNTMICYKYHAEKQDPVLGTADEKYVTSLWSSAKIKRPENHLIGITFTRGGFVQYGKMVPRGAGGYTMYRPDHWVFANTGLEYGDLFGNQERVVGYENDGCAFNFRDGLPYPTGEDGSPTEMEILAMAPATLEERTDRGYTDLYVGEDDLNICVEALFGEVTPENQNKIRYGHCMMVSFRRGEGEVFNAGGTNWSYGLKGSDPLIEQITHNVLRRFMQ